MEKLSVKDVGTVICSEGNSEELVDFAEKLGFPFDEWEGWNDNIVWGSDYPELSNEIDNAWAWLLQVACDKSVGVGVIDGFYKIYKKE